MRPALCLCVVFLVSLVYARRTVGGGSRRGGSSRPRTPAPPPPPVGTGSSGHFLNSERGSSSGSGTTHNRGDPFSGRPEPPSSQQTNGPIGFERVGGTTNQGNQKLGFDKVNSEVQNRPGSSQVPSAPQYPGGSHVPGAPQYPGGGPPLGPPPAYNPGIGFGGVNDHPPPYPGRPVNAPPSYSVDNPHYGQTKPSQPGFGANYPGQQNFGNTYPQQNQFGNSGQGSYHAPGGSSYPGNTGSYPGYSGNQFGGGSSFGNQYQGNNYGGSPFGSAGYNGNANYNPNNFGYSNSPGYFGSQGGYSGYPGQYGNYQKQSRFGGLPIPIPIPIPIPFGGGFGGGGFGGHSYNHRLLDTFIKTKNATSTDNSSTSVFILNNSTVAPCTTDHFVYDFLKVTVLSCTAEYCTSIKLSATTNVSSVVSVHSAFLTMCLENNATFSYNGDNVSPTVSEMKRETSTVCRDVPKGGAVNVTTEGVTTTPPSAGVATDTTDATTAHDTTTSEVFTTTFTPLNATVSNSTEVCEPVDCSWVEMCLPAIEVVDRCNAVDCPFTRTGYKACVKVKMCHSPGTPVGAFASLNTTISKIDEYNNHNSVYDAANLTLISYHRPVVSFNCSNSSATGCPPLPVSPPQPSCLPATSDPGKSSSPVNTTVCSPPTPSTSGAAVTVETSSSSPVPTR